MGRWSHYTEDEHRLPEGMQRVGYDADSQVYTFRDVDGSIWESAPGARYGVLTPTGFRSQVGKQSTHSTTESNAAQDEEDARRKAKVTRRFTDFSQLGGTQTSSNNIDKETSNASRLFKPILQLSRRLTLRKPPNAGKPAEPMKEKTMISSRPSRSSTI